MILSGSRDTNHTCANKVSEANTISDLLGNSFHEINLAIYNFHFPTNNRHLDLQICVLNRILDVVEGMKLKTHNNFNLFAYTFIFSI